MAMTADHDTDNLVILPSSGLRDRLKAVAERRYAPQEKDLGEFGVCYFRRLTGPELDELAQEQQKNRTMSTAEYDARIAALGLVADAGNQMTWKEILELGPAFYTPAREFVMEQTTDFQKKDEAEAKTDEPAPFLRMPTSSAHSAPSGDGPNSKSTNTPSSPRK
jgi:hypothetical protein